MPDAPAPGDADDLSISGDAVLWRRIPDWHFHWDDNERRARPRSGAFDDEEMSAILADPHRDPITALAGNLGWGLVAFTASFACSRGQIVVRDPQPDEPAHLLVKGRKTDSTLRAFARTAEWIIAPPQDFVLRHQ